MQLIVQFNLSPAEYCRRFHQLEISRPSCCPSCSASNSLHKHGCYWRNLITVDWEVLIPIARFLCRSCRKTVSMLPAFLLPYFQYTLNTILFFLRQSFETKDKCQKRFESLIRFYQHRFLKNLKLILSLLREQGRRDVIPYGKKERAIKLVCMLTVPTAETFSQRFHQHNKRNFMADLFYHKIRSSKSRPHPTELFSTNNELPLV